MLEVAGEHSADFLYGKWPTAVIVFAKAPKTIPLAPAEYPEAQRRAELPVQSDRVQSAAGLPWSLAVGSRRGIGPRAGGV